MFLMRQFVLLFYFCFCQGIHRKCEDSICVPYSECSEVHELLKNDDQLNQTRNLYCGYAHEPLVCCKRNCKTPNGNYGSIVHINSCMHLKQNKYSADRQKLNFLKESEVNRTHVCCKSGEDGYIVVPPAPTVQILRTSCNTPNGERGKCVDVEECEAYDEVVGEVDEKFRFINDSYCGWWGRPMICCGSKHYYTEQYSHELPSLNECGKWAVEESEQKFPPWIAFVTQANVGNGCAAALISDRYVLSTIRCFMNFTNSEIRLGDCINTPRPNCTFRADKIVTFPLNKYHKSEDTGMVLIKLDRKVEPPQAPICMPTSVLPLSIDIDILGLQRKSSTWTPFQITTVSIENQICENEFRDSYISRIVCIENGICETLPNLLQYLVVQYDNNRWILEGLLNRDRCYGSGNNLFHAVSVYKFASWIKSNIS